MRKTVLLMLSALLLLSMTACQPENYSPNSGNSIGTTANTENASGKIDVDLTKLSSTMIYSEVYNMMATPKAYLGKTVKMNGNLSVYRDEQTGKTYYACVIADATACCSQGLEFVLSDANAEYPSVGSEITVEGEFSTYMEGDNMYCNLINASMS